MTPAEPSQRGVAAIEVAGTLRRMFWVVIGRDEFGEDPLLLSDEDALPGGAWRWRLVAQTDDEAIAEEVMKLMVRRCYSAPPGAP